MNNEIDVKNLEFTLWKHQVLNPIVRKMREEKEASLNSIKKYDKVKTIREIIEDDYVRIPLGTCGYVLGIDPNHESFMVEFVMGKYGDVLDVNRNQIKKVEDE